jgi:phenylalanyl-tRNA synthetase alpha chain
MDIDVKLENEWREMLGSGMLHPTVLKNMGVDNSKFQGFAFGMGIDRLMMEKYGIDDIRLSYSSDLRALKQFNK